MWEGRNLGCKKYVSLEKRCLSDLQFLNGAFWSGFMPRCLYILALVSCYCVFWITHEKYVMPAGMVKTTVEFFHVSLLYDNT